MKPDPSNPIVSGAVLVRCYGYKELDPRCLLCEHSHLHARSPECNKICDVADGRACVIEGVLDVA